MFRVILLCGWQNVPKLSSFYTLFSYQFHSSCLCAQSLCTQSNSYSLIPQNLPVSIPRPQKTSSRLTAGNKLKLLYINVGPTASYRALLKIYRLFTWVLHKSLNEGIILARQVIGTFWTSLKNRVRVDDHSPVVMG